MKIGLLGDTHGNFGYMSYAAGKFYREGIQNVMQLGDLGIWPNQGTKDGFTRLDETLDKFGQTWYVTPGNHEDYGQIDTLAEAHPDTDFLVYRPHILLMRRGTRFEFDGMTFVSLGGAPSVDRTYRLQKFHGFWWAQEDMTDEDVQRTIDGGYADVMLSHDAPAGLDQIERRIKDNSWIPLQDQMYAREGRIRFTRAVREVHPEFLFHGHYHFKVIEDWVSEHDGEEHTTHVFGLSKDEENFSLGVLDTETRKAEIWDLNTDYARFRWQEPHELLDRLPQGWKRYTE